MLNQPLKAQDTMIVFADLQEGIVNVGTTADQGRLRIAVAALAELATIFSLPVAISCVPTTSGTVAPALTEITSRFPNAPQLVRTTANAMDDSGFRSAIEATGRRTIVLAGVASEVTVALTALAAARENYHIVIAVDACSGFDARSESAAFMHLSSAGIALSSLPAIAAELAGDFTSEPGRAAMRALQSTLATHGHAHAHDGHDHGHDDHDHDEHDHDHDRDDAAN